ncbi:MAG: DinB family protein [Chitinophaga sp.]|uniref:DinB family protein n=1 Tax=Chitinophaga sp. TaxID=1869181 RepID=UPI001B017A31|nr:DinB family protein [Chitinophaga sp.]MBO9729447.1 DinB family protein [Chitinophaga sp.]
MIHATTTPQTSFTAIARANAAWNLWANNTLLAWLETKSPELLDVEVTSSFSSIRKTLRHIWNVQDWWMACLLGEEPAFTYGEEYTGTVKDAMEGLTASSQRLHDYFEFLSATEMADTCRVAIPFTGDFDIPRFEMIQHVANHSSYHRGQVVTIARNVGITDAPMTDYMYWNLLER